jgi:hypothetical protein
MQKLICGYVFCIIYYKHKCFLLYQSSNSVQLFLRVYYKISLRECFADRNVAHLFPYTVGYQLR